MSHRGDDIRLTFYLKINQDAPPSKSWAGPTSLTERSKRGDKVIHIVPTLITPSEQTTKQDEQNQGLIKRNWHSFFHSILRFFEYIFHTRTRKPGSQFDG